jgi:hypothetical protein
MTTKEVNDIMHKFGLKLDGKILVYKKYYVCSLGEDYINRGETSLNFVDETTFDVENIIDSLVAEVKIKDKIVFIKNKIVQLRDEKLKEDFK